MIRVGRIMLNPAKIVKVVNDGRTKTTTVYLENGIKASFKKHSDKVWAHFKGSATNVAAPAAAASYSRRNGW